MFTPAYGAHNKASIIRPEHENQPTNAIRGFGLIPQDAAITATRFGLGARPGDLAEIGRDAKGWLTAQFAKEKSSLIDDAGLPGVQEGLAYLLAQRERAARRRRQGGGVQAPSAADQQQRRRDIRQAYLREVGARTRFALATPDPFRERMVRFWANHFSVTQGKGVGPAIGSLEREAVRPHVGGRFIDMLRAVESHPVMLIYLDNHQSIGPESRFGRRSGRGLNENLAREILELHTLGVHGGYGQADVTAFANVLTGWTLGRERFAPGRAGTFYYAPALHQPGAQTILGKRYGQRGVTQGQAVLEDLARHPATARHIAYKLAVHFVSDAPPPAVVDRLSRVFRDTDGDLAALAAALVDEPEAWVPLTKLKAPDDFIVSGLRGLGLRNLRDRVIVNAYTLLGQRPFHAPSPAGWPDTAEDWAGPEAIKKRLEWSNALAKRTGGLRDPQLVADDALGPLLSDRTREAVVRADSPPQALTLLLMSPEFQRR